MKKLPAMPARFLKLGFRVFEAHKSPDDYEIIGGLVSCDLKIDVCLPRSLFVEYGVDRVNELAKEIEEWLHELYLSSFFSSNP